MRKLGTYLDRSIVVLSYDEADSEGVASLVENAVLYVRCSDAKDNARLDSGLRSKMLSANPAVVAVSGPSAEREFDLLLAELNESPRSRHVMTKLLELDFDSSVSEFFQATWPAEERMESWTRYVLFVREGEVKAAVDAVSRHADA